MAFDRGFLTAGQPKNGLLTYRKGGRIFLARTRREFFFIDHNSHKTRVCMSCFQVSTSGLCYVLFKAETHLSSVHLQGFSAWVEQCFHVATILLHEWSNVFLLHPFCCMSGAMFSCCNHSVAWLEQCFPVATILLHEWSNVFLLQPFCCMSGAMFSCWNDSVAFVMSVTFS